MRAGASPFRVPHQRGRGAQCREIGPVAKLAVWTDGSGHFAAWFPDQIVVEMEDSSQYAATCREWIRGGARDRPRVYPTQKIRTEGFDSELEASRRDRMERPLLGPVLGFRGQQGDRWRLSVLLVPHDRSGQAPGPLSWSPAAGPAASLAASAAAAPGPASGSSHGGTAAPVRIHSYNDYSVYRYDFDVPMAPNQTLVYSYKVESVRGTGPFEFVVPPSSACPRFMFCSCNGVPDSALIKREEGINGLWLYAREDHIRQARPPSSPAPLPPPSPSYPVRQPFNLLVMGGDQVYADPMWSICRTLRRWSGLRTEGAKVRAKWTEQAAKEVRDFYWNLYTEQWSEVPRAAPRHAQPEPRRPEPSRGPPQPEPGWMFARVPMVCMWDDHDIFDGFGSYDDARQHCSTYAGIFAEASDAFRVFQARCDPELALCYQPRPGDTPGVLPPDFRGPYISAFRAGAAGIVCPDLRSQRSITRVMNQDQYDAIAGVARLWGAADFIEISPAAQRPAPAPAPPAAAPPLPPPQHIFIVSSIPVPPFGEGIMAFVDLAAGERVLDLVPGRQELEVRQGYPIPALRDVNALSLNARQDDLHDHCAPPPAGRAHASESSRDYAAVLRPGPAPVFLAPSAGCALRSRSSPCHTEERARFVHALAALGAACRARVTVLSGDVHVGALGLLRPTNGPHAGTILYQPVSSGIVAPPPPSGLRAGYRMLLAWHGFIRAFRRPARALRGKRSGAPRDETQLLVLHHERQERVPTRKPSQFVWAQNFMTLSPSPGAAIGGPPAYVARWVSRCRQCVKADAMLAPDARLLVIPPFGLDRRERGIHVPLPNRGGRPVAAASATPAAHAPRPAPLELGRLAGVPPAMGPGAPDAAAAAPAAAQQQKPGLGYFPAGLVRMRIERVTLVPAAVATGAPAAVPSVPVRVAGRGAPVLAPAAAAEE
eukprot:tig00000430_g608.t1